MQMILAELNLIAGQKMFKTTIKYKMQQGGERLTVNVYLEDQIGNW